MQRELFIRVPSPEVTEGVLRLHPVQGAEHHHTNVLEPTGRCVLKFLELCNTYTAAKKDVEGGIVGPLWCHSP